MKERCEYEIRLKAIRIYEETGRFGHAVERVHRSRGWLSKWLRRYRKFGLAGLRDQSRVPRHIPHQTPSLRGSRNRWRSGLEEVTMAAAGGPAMHLHPATKLSNQWVPPHTLERAYALPPDYQSVLTLEKLGSKKEFIMQPCNHFIEEIRYFVKNANSCDYVQQWQNEFFNQMKAINQISVAD